MKKIYGILSLVLVFFVALMLHATPIVTIVNGVFSGNGVGLTNVPGTSLTFNNPGYLQATTPTVSSGLPAASYAGQMLMTYSSSVGGSTAGQLWFAGNDLSWRNGMQFGRTVVFSTQGNEGLLVIVTNGLDNCITVQNMSSNHYSAMRFLDNYGSERGAVGWGNTNAPYYQGINYNEDDAAGWFYTSGGFIYGGIAKNGHFRWYQGNASTDTNSTIIFDVDLNGNLSIGSSANSSIGITATTSGGSLSIINTEGTSSYLNTSALDPNQSVSFTNLVLLRPRGGGHQITFANGYFFVDVDNSYNLIIEDYNGSPLETLNSNGGSSTAKFGGSLLVNLSSYQITSTNGFVSYATATGTIGSTGWTNNTGVNCQVKWSGTAVTVIEYNNAGTAWYTNSSVTGTEHSLVQAGGKIICSGGGLTGNYSAF